MQHATAQEPPQDVDQMPDPARFKEIRDRFFSSDRAGETPSRSRLPQSSVAGHNSDRHDRSSASASPRDHMESNIAALSQSSYGVMSNDNAGEDADARNKNKRELSTSKRAAQNRAAQRAFRQRKERYITELEEKVKQFETMETDYRTLQDENRQLREYILGLQAQLLGQSKDQSSSPASPPRKRRGLQPDDREAEREVQGQSMPSPHPPTRSPVATQGEMAVDGASYREHIDALREKYREQPTHRPSLGDEASYDSKPATTE